MRKEPQLHGPIGVGMEKFLSNKARELAAPGLPDDVSVCSPHGLGSASIPIANRTPPFRVKGGR